MANTPLVHWELMGPDADALTGFYSSIFGWAFAPALEGIPDYFFVDEGLTGVAGAVGKGNENMPTYHAIYFQVESIDETLEKAAANGGTVSVPRTEIPDVVTFALLQDPAGNLVGLTEAGPPAG